MTEWRKSSYSGGGNDDACVEVASFDDGIGVRDSKHPEGDRLELQPVAFGRLLSRIKHGRYE